MLKKIAINKEMLTKLLNLKRYEDIKEYVSQIRTDFEKIAKEKVDKYIENQIILSSEKDTFIELVEKSINEKFSSDELYLLVDEEYIDKIRNEGLKLRCVNKRKNYSR